MIQPQNGQPGVIGQQHGPQRLTTTLEVLELGQHAQHQRDIQTQTQLTSQAKAFAAVQAWQQRMVIALGALGLLVVLLAAAVGWQLWHPPDMSYARALGAVDGTLVQTWGSLPEAVQEQLSAVYGRIGLLPPDKRK